jgi:phosphopantetheinyl transferase
MMRRYLNESERAQHELVGPRAKRSWLLGRMAIKDAVRQYIWQRDASSSGSRAPIFPVEIEVGNTASGQPFVTSRFGDLRVSVAHKDDIAVAIVGEGHDVGIDIEKIAPRTDGFAATAYTPAEIALGTGRDHDEWLTRLWAAKEAVAKVRGTGMTDPKRVEVRAADGDRLVIDDDVVDTKRDGDYVIAVTRSNQRNLS